MIKKKLCFASHKVKSFFKILFYLDNTNFDKIFIKVQLKYLLNLNNTCNFKMMLAVWHLANTRKKMEGKIDPLMVVFKFLPLVIVQSQ